MDFIQLTKVAEDQQIIYARAICEEPDRSGQVADYLASKAAFQKWAAETQAASMGKSMGNIRVMHKPDVAGRVIDIQYDDVAKAIDVAIQVDRPDVWKMCKVGAYTGLSVGGSYGRKWADPQYAGMERYEPKLSELSIVDRPCVPSATFQLLKADGNVEERHFANVAFDADIIGTLKSMAAEHNAENPNEWAKAKVSDLKKVYKRGNLESLSKNDGNPLSDGLSRVQQFLSVLAATTQDCDDKDLLNKSHPIIVSGGGALRKKSPGMVDPNSTGDKVGAATAAGITAASIGYAGRAAGKALAVPVIPAMKASPKFRRAINAGDDAMTAAKRGIKNTARTGSFRAGAKTAVRTFKAIQNGTIKSKGILGITRSYRGAASVPAAIVGTGLAGLSFAHSYKSRRAAQKQNAEIHNALVAQMNKLEKAVKLPGVSTFAIGAHLAGAAIGAGAGALAAYRGNPYRDKDGKFTSKTNAAIVVGLGATAGAAAGFGGGLALTHRGLQHAYGDAQETAEKHVAAYAQSRSSLLSRGEQHYKLKEAVQNVVNAAAKRFGEVEELDKKPELEFKHDPYRAMAQDELLSSKNPDRASLLTPTSGRPTKAGHYAINRHAEKLRLDHTQLKTAVDRTKTELAGMARGAEGETKDKLMREAGKAHEAAQDALDQFESRFNPYAQKSAQDLNAERKEFSRERTILVERTQGGISIHGKHGITRGWDDLYKESARLRAEGTKSKDLPAEIIHFRKYHEKAFQAEHARVLRVHEANAKKLGYSSPIGAERFNRHVARIDSGLSRAQERAAAIKKTKENLLGARIASQMHRMTSRFTDVSGPMRNEANAAIRIARHALTPNSSLKGVYSTAKRKVTNVGKQAIFQIESKEEIKDKAGKVIGHNIKPREKQTWLGRYPEPDNKKLVALAGGVALGSAVTYRDDKGKIHFIKPNQVRAHATSTADRFHMSLTVPTRGNPQNRVYVAGLQTNQGKVDFLAPGRTAQHFEYSGGGGQQNQNNQQGGPRPFTPVALEGDDYKSLNAWRTVSGQNQKLVINKSEYGTRYRTHNTRDIPQDQMNTANNSANAMKKALDRVISNTKVEGKIPRDSLLPIIRQITGAEGVQVGSEKYNTSMLTARDQAAKIKELFPNSSGLKGYDPNTDEGKKTTATALVNLIQKKYSDGGIPDASSADGEKTVRGMVHVFRAANWLTDSGEKAAMGAVDARMGTERNPGQRKTTEPKMDYEPSDDKDFEATVSVLKEKYPDAPKMIIAQVLNKTRRDSKRRNDDFSDHDHLNAAYDEAYAQLDQLGYDSR